MNIDSETRTTNLKRVGNVIHRFRNDMLVLQYFLDKEDYVGIKNRFTKDYIVELFALLRELDETYVMFRDLK